MPRSAYRANRTGRTRNDAHHHRAIRERCYVGLETLAGQVQLVAGWAQLHRDLFASVEERHMVGQQSGRHRGSPVGAYGGADAPREPGLGSYHTGRQHDSCWQVVADRSTLTSRSRCGEQAAQEVGRQAGLTRGLAALEVLPAWLGAWLAPRRSARRHPCRDHDYQQCMSFSYLRLAKESVTSIGHTR
jgi:hypothetical protein